MTKVSLKEETSTSSQKEDARSTRKKALKARARASKRFASSKKRNKPAIFRIVVHPALAGVTKLVNEHEKHMRSMKQMRDTFLQQSEEF
jgi:hypothetical protein